MSHASDQTSKTEGNGSSGRLYEPLPEGNSVIRYMILDPGEGDDALSWTLHTMALNDPVPYEAISYVWGSTNRDHLANTAGEAIYITANLDCALRRVRSRSEPRTLWADSVCINQEDLAERENQVLLMGQVYGKAKRVLMYLGEDVNGHGEAVRSLVSEVEMMVLDGIGRVGKSWNSFPTLDAEDRERFLADRRWESLIIMTNLPWFTRGWVIQEAALAADALMLWGLTEISWRSIVRTYTWMIRRLPQVQARYKNGNQGMNRLHLELYRMRNVSETMPLYTKQASHFDFLIILHDARVLDVQDPQDRVYAFLSLATAAGLPLRIRPNYSDKNGTKEVYLNLAREYINSTSDINILHCVQHTEDSFSDGLPSWVPRWDLNLFDNIITHTSAPTLVPTDVRPTIYTGGILEVTGVIFDDILYTSQPLSRDVSIHDIKLIWDEVSGIHATSAYNPTYKALAFSQVLSVGRSWGAEWPQWIRWRTAYIDLLLGQGGHVLPPNDPRYQGIKAFHTYTQWNVHNRRIIVTNRGFYGVVPLLTRGGDLCCVLFGARTPCILRKTSTPGRYRLIGDAYIPGNSPPVHRDGSHILFSVGFNNRRDWAGWGAEEQEIHLC